MRAILMALAVTGMLTACAAHPPPASAPAGVPLRAWIAPPGHFPGVTFNINRPAHVAVFEIIPGRGIGMVYPAHGAADMYLSAGTHTAWTGLQSYRWGYFPSLSGFGNRGGYGGYGGYEGRQPRFLYLVASEAPLRIAELRASPMGLRNTLSLQHFSAWNPYAAMDELTRMILPMQGWGEWTTDLYVQWPDPPPLQLAARDQPRYVILTCRDGRTVLVPAGYGFTGCPGDEMIRSPNAGDEPEDGVRTPTRQRPDATTRTTGVTEAREGQPQRPARTRGAAGTTGEREGNEPRAEPTRRGPRGSEAQDGARPARTREPRAEPRGDPQPPRARPSEPQREARPAPSARPQPRATPRQSPPQRSAPPQRSEPSRQGSERSSEPTQQRK